MKNSATWFRVVTHGSTRSKPTTLSSLNFSIKNIKIVTHIQNPEIITQKHHNNSSNKQYKAKSYLTKSKPYY